MLRSVLKQNAEQQNAHLKPQVHHESTHYTPASWTAHFDQRIDVKPFAHSDDTFGVYIGAEPTADVNTVFLFLHGAGQSALSWALVAVLFASHLKRHVKVYALDFRGSTRTSEDLDLSADRLCNDVEAVCKHLFIPFENGKLPRVIIAGHSMGGAIAARVSDRIGATGLILVDIVEGTARAAYSHIKGIIESRPASFVSMSSAIAWSLSSNMLRNAESACISIPSQLVPQGPPDTGLRWHTPLTASYPYWDGWYVGLSELFLRCRATKALISAGIERLDKTLTIGQIQGKFQLTILPVETGHSVQEDAPKQTATVLLDFYHRYAAPPKV